MQVNSPDGGITTIDVSVDHKSWPCEHKRKDNGEVETCEEAERRRVGDRIKKMKMTGLTVEQVMEERR